MEEKRFITMRYFEIRKKIVPLGSLEDSLLWPDEQKNVNKKIMENIPQHNQDSLLQSYNTLQHKTKLNDKTYQTYMKNIKEDQRFNLPFNQQVLTRKYNELLGENIKNLTALKTFLEISLLQNPILEFSQQINQVTTNITNNLCNYHHNNNTILTKGSCKSPTSQNHSDMVSNGVAKSWECVEKMVRCAVVHVKHASKHCQYHIELHSLIKRLKEDADHVILSDQSYNDSCSSALRLATELKAKEKEINELGERVVELGVSGMQVVPIRLRTQRSNVPLTAVVTCDYVTPEIELKEGDEVEVVDRSNLYKWGVLMKGGNGNNMVNDKNMVNGVNMVNDENGVNLIHVQNGLNMRNDENGFNIVSGEDSRPKVVMVPSILLVVAGTDSELQDSIGTMYKEHGRMVVGNRRLMEGRVLRSMLQVFKKKYSNVEELLIQTLNAEAKEDLLNFFWSLREVMARIKDPELAYEVNDLNTRLDYLTRLINTNYISPSAVNPQETGIRGRVLVIQLNTLRFLLENFKIFSETCSRTTSETSKMRRASNGAYKSVYSHNKSHVKEQDDLISLENVIKRLDHIIARSGTDTMQVQHSEEKLRRMSDKEFLDHIRDLSNFVQDYESDNLTEENKKLPLNYACDEEMDYLIDEVVVGKGEDYVDARVSEGEDEREGVKISETEHMYAAESEENKKFVITAVIDPDSKEDISLAQAIERKIIDPENGSFLIGTNMRIPIAVAMAQNLIKVQSTVVNKTCERKLSVGVVTIKTTHHVSKQSKQSLVNERSVLVVMDLKWGRRLSWRQAVKEGLINKEHFIDTRDNSTHSLDHAEYKGWIKRSRVSSPSNLSTAIPPPDVIPEVKSITYAVRKVKDRKSGKMLSFIEACRQGLFDRDSALYFDLLSDKKHSLEEAIQLGYVQADLVDDAKSIHLLQGSSWF